MSNRKKLRGRGGSGFKGDAAMRQAMLLSPSRAGQGTPVETESDAATRQAMLQLIAGLQAMTERMDAHSEALVAARRVWSGGNDPVPPEAPAWPDGSVGDRFFSGMLLDEASKAPSLRAAAVPDAHVIAADPAHWNIATWALVRAVILDGMPVDDPAASRLLDVLAPFAAAEFAYGEAWANGTGWMGDEPEFPEEDGPGFLLGACALVDATWALIGEDSLNEVLGVLVPALSDALPGLEGQVVAEALVGAFACHYRCEMPGDAEMLERLGIMDSGNALENLVTAKLVAPGDSLRMGLAVLSVLAELGKSGSPSVLHDHRVRSLS